jgi:2-polyprenyl-3-methyl-5-hydroxy-6-metoxy-1,4-benzoquinol methylase
MPYIFGKQVLELGCGGGFMSWAMGLWAQSVVGVDLSEASIRYATRTFKKPTFLCQPMSEIGRQGETFDFVFSSELFEHLPGVDEVMDCIVRVTKPGSFVYVSAPDASHPRTPKDLTTWIDICPPEHLQWFGRKSLALLFDQHGFDVHKFMHNPKPAHNALFRRR